ncbi:MAG: stage III sporulation protein AC [Lachnospirales bacterium]
MEVDIIFQVAFVGILVAVINQVLARAGRDDQAMMTSLVGIIVVLYWVINYISQLFTTIMELFSL